MVISNKFGQYKSLKEKISNTIVSRMIYAAFSLFIFTCQDCFSITRHFVFLNFFFLCWAKHLRKEPKNYNLGDFSRGVRGAVALCRPSLALPLVRIESYQRTWAILLIRLDCSFLIMIPLWQLEVFGQQNSRWIAAINREGKNLLGVAGELQMGLSITSM